LQRENWCVIGGGPSARLDSPDDWTTIATNSGILVCPMPTYYWVSDNVALALFRAEIQAAYDGGTQLVTSHYSWRMLEDAGLHGGLIRKYTDQYSGICAVRFALENKPKRLRVIGLDGYWPKANSFMDPT
jgi:hypothetical protein